jgi:hypothetical protein
LRLRDSARPGTSGFFAGVRILGGRYRLDGLLGSGGAADVHRGFDLRLRRPVAVKVFRSGTDVDTEQDVHAEAVILARLNHPGLVTVYDAGQHDGRVYLVLQLIEGTTLRDRIAQGPLSFQATAALGADLSRALAHAHEAKIVHRDVKPSNILLDATCRPHLTDFGISRLLDATTRTATEPLTGTAAYLSPEQILGKPVGLPADVYALGLVLLECLTARLEYDGGPLEAAIARLHRPPVLPDPMPEQLAELLRKMTALDEQDRPSALDCAGVLADPAAVGAGSTPAVAQTRVPSLPSDHGSAPLSGHGQAPTSAHGRAQTAGRTPSNPLPDAPPATPRTASLRGRTLVAGAAAALAAVMGTALVVTENAASHGKDDSTTRATSSAAGTPQPSDRAARQKKATASPGTSTAGSGDAPARSGHSAAADRNLADVTHEPAGLGTPSAPDTAAAQAPGGGTAAASHEPPGQAKKTQNPGKDGKETKTKKP